jgi:hypothetical protein
MLKVFCAQIVVKGLRYMYSIANYKYVLRTLFMGINKMACIIIATYACLRFGRCCLCYDCSYAAYIYPLVYVPHTESLRLI